MRCTTTRGPPSRDGIEDGHRLLRRRRRRDLLHHAGPGELLKYQPGAGSFADYAEEFLGSTGYRVPSVPQWVSAAVVLLALLTANLISVKLFGEFEFWFSLIEVVTIILVIALGLSIILFARLATWARRQPSPTSGATGSCSPTAWGDAPRSPDRDVRLPRRRARRHDRG
jgi:hypothetical protein